MAGAKEKVKRRLIRRGGETEFSAGIQWRCYGLVAVFGEQQPSASQEEVCILRNNLQVIAAALSASMAITPAWAAGHGGGAGGSGHGATASAAAMPARQSGTPVGASVRSAARANSQGSLHVNANAISHVQNSARQANASSVLGSGGATSTTTSASTSPSVTGTRTQTAAGTKAKVKGAKSKAGASIPQQ
jgi:hypothetical protein